MKFRVTSYDVGPARTLRPNALLRMIQEAAGRHLEQDGLSYEFMRARGLVFLLAKESVVFHTHPHCDDVLTVETWFQKTEGVAFVRNMRFLNARGDILVEAVTQWVTVNPDTHRILRPSAFPFSMPSVDEPVSACVSRIPVVEAGETAGERPVRYSDIDCNSHMNNTVYADILCDYFPGGFSGRELTRFQIDFCTEAVLGDVMRIRTLKTADGIVFEGDVGAKRCFSALAQAASPAREEDAGAGEAKPGETAAQKIRKNLYGKLLQNSEKRL